MGRKVKTIDELIDELCNQFNQSAKDCYYEGYDAGYSKGYDQGAASANRAKVEGINSSESDLDAAFERGLQEAWSCATTICNSTISTLLDMGFTVDGIDANGVDEYEFSCIVISDNSIENVLPKVNDWKRAQAEAKSESVAKKEFLRIVVSGKSDKPYYTIDYIEDGEEYNGYGSYNLEYVMQWKQEMQEGKI